MVLFKTKISFGQIALGLILAGAILLFYWPALVSLANSLTGNEDYSFGLLLPLVSAYLIYLKWPKLLRHHWQPSWMGLAVIFLGFGIYVLGDLAAAFYFPPFSFIVVLTGLLWLAGGWALVWELAFPLFLLFFMIPLPAMVMKTLTLPLQMISSKLASGMLQVIGIPVLRQGNVLDLGVRQLQVVDACSGLRYILSLSALGLIYCYFYQRSLWKAAILLICIIPAAILANALRVAAMALFPALQEGFWHSFSGWLIFVVVFALLALVNWLLDYLKPPVSPPEEDAGVATAGAAETPAAPRPSYTPYLLATLVLVLVAGQIALRVARAPAVPLLQSLDNFPLQLGAYQGRRTYLDRAMATAVGADAYLEADYTSPESEPVSLWIAYFESQSQKVEGRVHSPLMCLTGGGWHILESRIEEVAPGLPARYLLMEQGGSRMVVYYWYIEQGRWLASEYSSRLFMGWNGLIKRRNDAALVRLITPAGGDVAQTRERLTAFARLLVPVLPKFIQE
jgi:exosortase D (VPLPA-CTERM-specific)